MSKYKNLHKMFMTFLNNCIIGFPLLGHLGPRCIIFIILVKILVVIYIYIWKLNISICC